MYAYRTLFNYVESRKASPKMNIEYKISLSIFCTTSVQIFFSVAHI